jgi:predicted phosphohydrolase
MLNKGSEYFKKYNIHHLERGLWVKDNVLFVGWDGWYHNPNPNTKDEDFIPGGWHSMEVLARRAHKKLEEVLYTLDAFPSKVSKVVVTHMAPFDHPKIKGEYNANPVYMDFLEGKCDVLCYGHTHRALDEVVQGVRCINSGSDYNKPNLAIFEV